MFERFTDRARDVVKLAQEDARRLKHNYIGTEHVLLGLLRSEGLAARVLDSLGITHERVRVRVVEEIGLGDEVISGQIPFTPRAKKILELSLREALSLGHNYIGTEHILLGIEREREGVAARLLREFGADPEKVRNEVVRLLSGPAGPSFDAGELVRWAESYGHPEEWVKRAQAAHGRAERLLGERDRLEEAGEGLAIIARTLLADGELGPAGERTLRAWNEARNALRPGGDLAEPER